MMRSKSALTLSICAIVVAPLARTQNTDLVLVISKQTSRLADLPGEFLPYLSVSLHAKVPGYIERISVDRGSKVEAGQLLAELSAPEMTSRIAEAESKVQAAEAERLQAEVQLEAAQSTYEHMKNAAETPGAIAGNELIQSEKQVEAAKALLNSRIQASRAAEAAVKSARDLEAYLRITAPFDGIVSERLVHPGALVGPGADPILLTIQQISRLRLVVAVPEEYVGGIMEGAKVAFQVPAYPERTYSGTVARLSHALDQKTRTMAVELDVTNIGGSLAPGMYPTVKWPVKRAHAALFVPKTSVVTTTERIFVIRNNDGRAEWVDIRKGSAEGDLVEVLGDLKVGDKVVRRANDEIREGTPLQSQEKR
jgi:RND family efflux transporter MFP subunit